MPVNHNRLDFSAQAKALGEPNFLSLLRALMTLEPLNVSIKENKIPHAAFVSNMATTGLEIMTLSNHLGIG